MTGTSPEWGSAALLGRSSADNDDVALALRLVVAGACVVSVDHLPKGSESRVSGYAIGGTAKKRAMTGAYLLGEAPPLSDFCVSTRRPWAKGHRE